MNKAWSASKSSRRNRGGGSKGSRGSAASDDSSLSFLDDMLGGPSHHHGGAGGTRSGGGGGPQATSKDADDIDDILDIVSNEFTATKSTNKALKKEESGGTTRTTELSESKSDPLFPNSIPTTSNNNRTGSASNLRRFDGSSSSSRDNKNNRQLSSPSGQQQPLEQDPASASRGQIQENTHFPSAGEAKNRSAPAVETTEDVATAPIPFFGINTNQQHDDDTISQITTSIASQSLYDSHGMSHESKGSGSFPWLRNNNGSHNSNNHFNRPGQHHQNSQGENSYADTLDEIADMLHPAQQSHRVVNNTSRSPARSPHYRNTQVPDNNNHFRSKAAADLGLDDAILGKSSPHTDESLQRNANLLLGDDDDDHKTKRRDVFDASEIYKSTKRPIHATRAGLRSSSRASSLFEPMLSQVRLQFRYWFSIIIPREWRRARKQQQKDEEIPGSSSETDYFHKLMRNGSGSHQQQQSPKKMPRNGRRRRRGCCSSILFLFFLFCLLTFGLLMIRLLLMHAPTWKLQQRFYNLHKNGNNKRANKHHRNNRAQQQEQLQQQQQQQHGEERNIRGGMATRGNNNQQQRDADVRGGMAKRDVSSDSRATSNEEFQHHHAGTIIPSAFDNLADVTDLPFQSGKDIPFFWHIPRTGGGTVNDIFGGCLHLTLASDAGGGGPAGQSRSLEVVKLSKHFSYINVDTSTPAGIERAKSLHLTSSGLVNIVVSTLLHQSSTLFTTHNRGRMFTMFRHPVERATSLFHYVKDTQWRRRQTFRKELSDLSIDEYFKSGLAENNWMTRFLTNELTKGELTKSDVMVAKEVLRRKCLVGLLKEKGESFARFERYFGFPVHDDDQRDCHEKKLQWAWPLKHRHDEVEEGTPLYDLIMSHNMWDMELYKYAQVLFQEQAKMFR